MCPQRTNKMDFKCFLFRNKVEEDRFHSINVIATTFYKHYDEILNFYKNRSTNAMAESFNAKIKLFRANLRGVADKKFFLFRIAKLYGYTNNEKFKGYVGLPSCIFNSYSLSVIIPFFKLSFKFATFP